MKQDVRKYSKERVNIIDSYDVVSGNLERFLESFPPDEKEIGRYIYKRLNRFPNLVNSYKETKSLIEKILKSFGYSDEYIKSYINKYKILLLQTPEEIYRRLAILSACGIDERMAMEDVSLLTNYNDTIVYLAAKGVKEQKEKLYEVWEKERALKEMEKALNKDNKSDDELQEEDDSFDPRVYPGDVRNYICNNELNATKLTSFEIYSLTRRYVQTKTF